MSLHNLCEAAATHNHISPPPISSSLTPLQPQTFLRHPRSSVAPDTTNQPYVMDPDSSASPSIESTPGPTSSPTPGPVVARRKATRGRKLGHLDPESIADLPLHEQEQVLQHSRKYQQKAAALFRALRHPHAHQLTNSTVLKACVTCSSQAWPCVLIVVTKFGLRKQVSRCVGCRHTRSTCSLKETVHAWSEGSGVMPWDADVDGEAATDTPGPTPAPNAVERLSSPWTGPSGLTGPALNVPLTAPVSITLPPFMPDEFRDFLEAVAPNMLALHPSVQSAIINLVHSIGGQIAPQTASETTTNSSAAYDNTPNHHVGSSVYTAPPFSTSPVSISRVYADAHAPLPRRMTDMVVEELNDEQDQDGGFRSFASSDTDSPVRIKTPLPAVIEQPDSPLFTQSRLEQGRPRTLGLGLDVQHPTGVFPPPPVPNTGMFYQMGNGGYERRGSYEEHHDRYHEDERYDHHDCHEDRHEHHPTPPPLVPSHQRAPALLSPKLRPRAKTSSHSNSKPKSKMTANVYKAKRTPTASPTYKSPSPAPSSEHLDHAETLLAIGQGSSSTSNLRSVSVPAPASGVPGANAWAAHGWRSVSQSPARQTPPRSSYPSWRTQLP